MQNFGKQLIRLRTLRNLKQNELAGKLNISPRMLLRWEKNEVKPGFEHLTNLSRALAVSVDELLGLAQPDDPAAKELAVLLSHLKPAHKQAVLEIVRGLLA
jgi:transcriptional regulator with XRE-family HTH domain